MDYVITFADVMAGLIALGGGLMMFLIKRWFTSIEQGNQEIQNQIIENDRKTNERIEKLEQKHDTDMQEMRTEMTQLKSDLPIVYVLRDDYIRVANNMESQINRIGEKIDTLIFSIGK